MAHLHLNIEHTKDGQEFFTVYTVIGLWDGEKHNLHTFTTRKKAEDYRNFVKKVYSRYSQVWIRETLVWTD